MKIAVVGTGVAGLVVARALARQHELTVFEASEWIGGHAHTLDIALRDGGSVAVDTGFVVFNELTYPHFSELLRTLGVASQPSDMSFSVRAERGNFEYGASSWDALLAQRRNALRPRFWRMLRDILRFYREAPAALSGAERDATLGEYLDERRYSRAFVEDHLLPMVSAVWSARGADARAMPLAFLVRFFQNHGFLRVAGRPQWRTVCGGSRTYIEALVAPFRARIRLATPVRRVERRGGGSDGLRLVTAAGESMHFERVVLATHADQALRLLVDADPHEREILGAFSFQANDVVLHTDTTLMPRARRAWASWNYHVAAPPAELPTVTYWMNRLQALPGDVPYLVTLNRTTEIDPRRILARFTYHHPLFSHAAVAAQTRQAEIDGVNGVHFAGAYWGNGFHEDGVRSARTVSARLGAEVLA